MVRGMLLGLPIGEWIDVCQTLALVAAIGMFAFVLNLGRREARGAAEALAQMVESQARTRSEIARLADRITALERRQP